MSKQIIIRNTTELLEFVKRKDIDVKQATQIVCKALTVICLIDLNKQELIKETEFYINEYCKAGTTERPIFFGQRQIDFDVKQIFKDR